MHSQPPRLTHYCSTFCVLFWDLKWSNCSGWAVRLVSTSGAVITHLVSLSGNESVLEQQH